MTHTSFGSSSGKRVATHNRIPLVVPQISQQSAHGARVRERLRVLPVFGVVVAALGAFKRQIRVMLAKAKERVDQFFGRQGRELRRAGRLALGADHLVDAARSVLALTLDELGDEARVVLAHLAVVLAERAAHDERAAAVLEKVAAHLVVGADVYAVGGVVCELALLRALGARDARLRALGAVRRERRHGDHLAAVGARCARARTQRYLHGGLERVGKRACGERAAL
eukprot:1980783-Pleurochrysis_carterae.AAC.3